jgi:hypothetical protein
MRYKCLSVILFLVILVVPSILFCAGEKIAVIAPSVSTSIEARSIMYQNGFVYSDFRNADGILVVVRSMLWYPLYNNYDSVSDLKRAADMQLNIVGTNFHVYLYSFNNDLSVTQVYHDYYQAE